MTDQSAAGFQDLFNAMIAKHGGADLLSVLDVEIVTICCNTMINMRSVDASEAAKMAAVIVQLTSTLPAPIEDAGEDFDIRRWDDSELREYERLCCKATNQSIPPWAIEQEASPAIEHTARERTALQLAKYVDERAAGWVHGGLSKCSALEINHLRSELNDLTSPIPCRMIWRDVFMQDVEGMIEDAVRKALAAVGSDAKVVAPTPAELEPFKQISIHDHPLAPVKNGPGT